MATFTLHVDDTYTGVTVSQRVENELQGKLLGRFALKFIRSGNFVVVRDKDTSVGGDDVVLHYEEKD